METRCVKCNEVLMPAQRGDVPLIERGYLWAPKITVVDIEYQECPGCGRRDLWVPNPSGLRSLLDTTFSGSVTFDGEVWRKV